MASRPMRTASAVPRCGSWRIVAARSPHRGLDRIGPVAGHDHRTLDADRRERVKDVEDERAAGKRVQHLRDAGAHAGALARGQDDGLGRGQDGRHVARW